ncbi:hypothetical protein CTEN210_12979 [Chaetoceros tenuissimus]|uniref:Uncharacterized protein n=1 Tax=Chaetoceros tenuissimus TaxID=426638 RepID=A0AAD3D2K3_9STRA|nr:hypothetical protein CTEN210_12979 [Chaetoceros tenuissimus]
MNDQKEPLSKDKIRKIPSLMKAWSKSVNSGDQTLRLFNILLQHCQLDTEHEYLTPQIGNYVLEAFMNEDPLKCTEFLHRWIDLDIAKPNARSFNLVFKSWVRSRSTDACEQMKSLLKLMEEYESNQDQNCAAAYFSSIQSYNYYLYALANRVHASSSQRKQDANDALELLQNIEEKALKDSIFQPDINTYNQVFSILAKSIRVEYAKEATSILNKIVENVEYTLSDTSGNARTHSLVYPTTDTFNAVMNCWLKADPKNARNKVEMLLDKMITLHETYQHIPQVQTYPDKVTINTLISSYTKSHRKDAIPKAYSTLTSMDSKYGIEASTTSFNIVLNAYAKSKRDLQGHKKAIKLLDKMEILHQQGSLHVKPDSFSYSTVIDAIAARSDSGKQAHGILDQMIAFHQHHSGDRPDRVVYNSLINAYSAQGDEDSILCIEDLLQTMEESAFENVKPNIITYNTILKAYANARTSCTDKAEALLYRLEQSKNKSTIQPDVISYTSVISAYARSDAADKATKAQEISKQMITLYREQKVEAVKPSIYTFNAVLNACAYTFDQDEKIRALVVVVETLVAIQEFAKSDHTTYGTLLKAFVNLIPANDKRRRRVVKAVFKVCCTEGMVGNMVLRQLRFAAPADLYEELLGRSIDDEVKLSSLPSKWSRNVRERYK